MDASERHERMAKYMSSKEEIEAACAEIQKTWTPAERRRRSRPERPVDMGTLFHVVGRMDDDTGTL